MSQAKLDQLETQVDDLLKAFRRVQVENKTLTEEFTALTRRSTETRQRLLAVIERIKALEEEAEAQQA